MLATAQLFGLSFVAGMAWLCSGRDQLRLQILVARILLAGHPRWAAFLYAYSCDFVCVQLAWFRVNMHLWGMIGDTSNYPSALFYLQLSGNLG